MKSAIPVPPKVARGGRWVVDRTMAWLSKLRGNQIQSEKTAQDYLGILKLARGLLSLRRLTHVG